MNWFKKLFNNNELKEIDLEGTIITIKDANPYEIEKFQKYIKSRQKDNKLSFVTSREIYVHKIKQKD